jgi:antitoxin (DNA-binding transcriptional repressor) of toxin-antitoxin stability system
LAVRAVGLKVLKNKLSEYVRLAQGGEVILVTDRDRVVAELVPPREGRSEAVSDAVLAELVRKGWVTPASRPLTGPPPRAPLARFRELMRELDADRADR